MGVKYTLPFKSFDDTLWRVDVANISYTGPIISIKGNGEAVTLEYDGDTDDPFSALIKSKVTVNCNNEGQIDINELQLSNTKDFTISLYRENSLFWAGYLDNSGIQQPMKSLPYALQLVATDGLDLLEDIAYVHQDLQGTTAEISRCPMNYFRQILFVNLGIVLPIRWTNNVVCTAFDEDVFTGSVRWANDLQGFNSYQTTDNGDAVTVKTCDYILTGILQAFQCRIYQSDGLWIIERIPDIVSGIVKYKQIAADLNMMVVQTANNNLNNIIGRNGFPFTAEDAVLTVKPGISSCTVTYTANVRDNIIPNGNQDYLNPSGNGPLYWNAYNDTITEALLVITPVEGLDARGGHAWRLSKLFSPPENISYYTMIANSSPIGPNSDVLKKDGLPIDTLVMIKVINFGFTFSPEFGFTADPSTGIINFGNSFQIQVVFNDGINTYYLNEFGFWQVAEVFISIQIDGMKLNEVAEVNFDAFQGVKMPTPASQPIAGYRSDIQILFKVNGGQQYVIDNITISIDGGNNVYQSLIPDSKNTLTDTRELNISSSFSGYMISNFQTSPFTSDTECFFRDGAVYEGTLTGLTANAIMRYRYKASRIFNGSINVRNRKWTFDQIYTIDSLGASKFLPLNASYNIETCVVSGLVAMECRNDLITLTEKYYSSNDNQLSN